MSDATVQVPAVGRVKKQYVIVGAAVVAGIVGYAYWRSANSAPADIPAYTEADVATEGITDTAGGAAGGSANSGGLVVDNSTTPDSDAEWSRQATELLGGSFDTGALAVALGKYITRQPLNAAEQNMVRAAIGALGYPPGGHYPIEADMSSDPSTFGEPTGVKVTGSTASSVSLSWNKVAGAPGYRIYRADLGNEPIGDSADTKFEARGLQPNKAYTFLVAARTATGGPGPKSAPVTGKTATVKLGKPSTPTVSGITRTTAVVKTGKVTGADRYAWYINGVAHGSSDGPTYTVVGLKPNAAYQVSVAADNSTQAPGPQSSRKSFRTKK